VTLYSYFRHTTSKRTRSVIHGLAALIFTAVVLIRCAALSRTSWKRWHEELQSINRMTDQARELGLLTEKEAVAYLRRAGIALSQSRIDGNNLWTPYSDDCLTVDFARLCDYFRKPQPSTLPGALLCVVEIVMSLTVYLIPGYKIHRIREAILSENPEPTSFAKWCHEERCSLETFGHTIFSNAQALVYAPSSISREARKNIAGSIENLERGDKVETPTSALGGAQNLHSILQDAIMPNHRTRLLEAYSVAVLTVIFCLLVLVLGGASFFTLPLVALALCTAAFCAIIAETLINNLSATTFASCKTFAYGATVILGLGTLLIGYGISHPVKNGIGPIPGIIAYFIILIGSTSATNLVNHGEAQLRKLTRA
jgi:hypothetical protein